LVFGVSSGEGGLGWYIFQNRNTPTRCSPVWPWSLIGLAVESFVFQALERITVRRWGVQR
jgi:NitT/TauT family transport system permease protein